MKLKYIWLLLIFVGFVACDDYEYDMPNEVTVDLDAGSADFSKYVAIGNSLTAGFTDGALFQAGQNNSLPNILAQKMALVGGGAFTQPFTNDNIGGLLLGGHKIQNQRLYFNGSGPALIDAQPTTETTSIVSGPFNNMGVPGAKSFHLLANGYGNVAGVATGQANPYFARMASGPNASVMEDVMVQGPTFFSLWIGANDVLSYALAGGTGVNQAGNYDPSTYGGSDITDPLVFGQVYNGLVGALTSGGAKGIIANIPYITTIPHFTTIPHNPLDPSNPAFGPQIPALNALFGQLNQAYAYLGSLGLDVSGRSVVFSETEASAMLIHDESLPNLAAQLTQVLMGGGLDPLTAGLLANQFGQSRQATADDLFVLTSSTVIATLNEEYFGQLVAAGVPQATAGQLSINGITYPMHDKWVLLPSEQDEIKVATDAFNAVISGIANSSTGLAFLDANALMQEMADEDGFKSGKFDLTAALVLGGAFSLDGVHLTARGSGAVANEMLKAIDATYGSNFKAAGELVDIGELPAFYPASLR
ncbi:MAG: G-D-S-L family lipolytic protein [Flavobacteriaceae bacterium]|nr:G-D-S-L family lipolytic protein [Flavobacteriaceae bacterium]